MEFDMMIAMRLATYFFGDYLEKKESIAHVVHRSLVTLFPDLLRIAIIGFLLPAALYFVFPDLLIASLVWFVFGLWRFIFELYLWYYHVWLVTDRAVLEIRSDGLFHVSATRIEYHMVEGISYSISGFLATLFRYGDLVIDRAGSPSVTFPSASSPSAAETVILKCQELYMDSRTTRDHKTLQALLAGMVREHSKDHGIPDVTEEE
jgi:hypothetical protein